MRSTRPEDGTAALEGSFQRGTNLRRRGLVGVSLVVGAGILGATLAAPSGSTLFYGLGFLAAVTWTAGGVLSGPIRWTGDGAGRIGLSDVAFPILVGAGLFGAFWAAKLVADQIPFLSHGVGSVLARADAGSRIVALVVALINAVGEEVFFRGALYDSFDRHRALWATAIYCLVTVATLNVALVAAAVVMGSVLALERRATSGVLAPILTHLTWSTLVLLLLPR